MFWMLDLKIKTKEQLCERLFDSNESGYSLIENKTLLPQALCSQTSFGQFICHLKTCQFPSFRMSSWYFQGRHDDSFFHSACPASWDEFTMVYFAQIKLHQRDLWENAICLINRSLPETLGVLGRLRSSLGFQVYQGINSLSVSGQLHFGMWWSRLQSAVATPKATKDSECCWTIVFQ